MSDSEYLLQQTEKVISVEQFTEMHGRNYIDQNIRKVFSVSCEDGVLNDVTPDDKHLNMIPQKKMTEPFLESDAVTLSTGHFTITESI